MNTIQVVIEEDLRERLRRLRIADLERRERDAYEQTPDDPAEFAVWDEVAAWPVVDKG
jgi:hypothetical protein